MTCKCAATTEEHLKGLHIVLGGRKYKLDKLQVTYITDVKYIYIYFYWKCKYFH